MYIYIDRCGTYDDVTRYKANKRFDVVGRYWYQVPVPSLKVKIPEYVTGDYGYGGTSTPVPGTRYQYR
jgi:hypothetical protein